MTVEVADVSGGEEININQIKLNTESQSQLKLSSKIPVDSQNLLIKYEGVFSIPNGLPASRLCNNRIPLKPNSDPVKIKLYRYPHS